MNTPSTAPQAQPLRTQPGARAGIPLADLLPKQRGRSLIELMVALLIGSIVLAGVLYVAAGTGSSGKRTDALGQMTESGQVALQLLADEVRQAGYSFPVLQASQTVVRATKSYARSGIVGCDAEFSNIKGDDAAEDFDALECPEADAGDSSSIAVTYETDRYNAMTATSTNNQGFVPRDCRGFELETAPGAGLKDGNKKTDASEDLVPSGSSNSSYWRLENRYFIGPYTDDDDTPSLRCTGNGTAAPFGQSVALVRGVERMVITYGVGAAVLNDEAGTDDILVVTGGVINYMSAEDINTTWATESASTRWQRVVVARICLQLVGEPGSADLVSKDNYGSFIDCDGTTTTITDGKQRRTVSMAVNLRNRTTIPQDGVLGYGGV